MITHDSVAIQVIINPPVTYILAGLNIWVVINEFKSSTSGRWLFRSRSWTSDYYVSIYIYKICMCSCPIATSGDAKTQQGVI